MSDAAQLTNPPHRHNGDIGEDILMMIEQDMMVKLKEIKDGDEDVITDIEMATIELNKLGENTLD